MKSPSTTLTVRIPAALKGKLERLAKGTRRSKSFLAGEAISQYVGRELEIVEDILRGMQDVRAGRFVTHEDAMARLERTIARAKQRKKRAAR